jgi:ABC-2 type transport system ATP-binding protein
VHAIEADHLAKLYDGKEAVKDVTLRVEKGVVYGFLGPNGAGKTTTIRMLTTLVPPSRGEARVLGYDLKRQGAEVRSRIGVVLQGESYEFSKTVEEALRLYGKLWDVPGREREERIEKLLDAFELTQYRDRFVQELSLGIRRRLQVAREFIHDADLLFLDEPTVGLDPLARKRTIGMIRDSVKKGLTVFLTTQLLDEAESLCDKVAVIFQGRVISEGTPRELKEAYGGVRLLEVSVVNGDPRLLVARMEGTKGVSRVASEPDGKVHVWTIEPTASFDAIVQAGEELGLVLGSVTLREPNLEQAFVNLIQGQGSGT